MTDREIKQMFAKILMLHGVNYVKLHDGETWINGELVCENGDIIN